MPDTTTTVPTTTTVLDVADITERWTSPASRELRIGGTVDAPWAIDTAATGCGAPDGEVSLGRIAAEISGAALGAWLNDHVGLVRAALAGAAWREGAGDAAAFALTEALSEAQTDGSIAAYWPADQWLDGASPIDPSDIPAGCATIDEWAAAWVADAAPEALLDEDELVEELETRMRASIEDADDITTDEDAERIAEAVLLLAAPMLRTETPPARPDYVALAQRIIDADVYAVAELERALEALDACEACGDAALVAASLAAIRAALVDCMVWAGDVGTDDYDYGQIAAVPDGDMVTVVWSSECALSAPAGDLIPGRAAPCQCGAVSDSACAGDLVAGAVVHVRWVPPYLRGTAEAAGTWRGAEQTLYVTESCAEHLTDDPWIVVEASEVAS